MIPHFCCRGERRTEFLQPGLVTLDLPLDLVDELWELLLDLSEERAAAFLPERLGSAVLRIDDRPRPATEKRSFHLVPLVACELDFFPGAVAENVPPEPQPVRTMFIFSETQICLLIIRVLLDPVRLGDNSEGALFARNVFLGDLESLLEAELLLGGNDC